MVFVLIITTNLIDKNNFVRVRDSVVTIYEDRLIASDLIFDMLKLVQEKELAVVASDSSFFVSQNSKVNADLQSLVNRFEQTKLTTEESKVFKELKNNMESLMDSESQLKDSNTSNHSKILNDISVLKHNLTDLSKIQLNEGSKQMSISKQAVDTVELFTHIEIYLLVFLAIVIQIIIMYNPKKKS